MQLILWIYLLVPTASCIDSVKQYNKARQGFEPYYIIPSTKVVASLEKKDSIDFDVAHGEDFQNCYEVFVTRQKVTQIVKVGAKPYP